jgi:hypothetical protein
MHVLVTAKLESLTNTRRFVLTSSDWISNFPKFQRWPNANTTKEIIMVLMIVRAFLRMLSNTHCKAGCRLRQAVHDTTHAHRMHRSMNTGRQELQNATSPTANKNTLSHIAWQSDDTALIWYSSSYNRKATSPKPP